MKRLVKVDRGLFIEVSIYDYNKYTTQELIDRFKRRQSRENNDAPNYRSGGHTIKKIPVDDLRALKRREVTAKQLASKYGVSATTVRNCLMREEL